MYFLDRPDKENGLCASHHKMKKKKTVIET